MPANNSAEYPYKEPFLSKPDDNDLAKQWVVEYGVWSEKHRKIKRKRVVLSGKTVEARLADAKQVIKEVKKLLKEGHVVDPEEPVKPVVSPVQKVATLNDIAITDAIEQYLVFVKQALSGNSLKTYTTALRLLKRYLIRHKPKKYRLTQFSTVDAQEFLDELITVEKLSNRTRNNTRGSVTTFFKFFIKRDKTKKFKDNPFEDSSKLPQNNHKHKAFSDRQREAFRKYCEEHGYEQLMLFCQFIYYTFFRPGEEVRRMKIGDIRKTAVFIPAEHAKNDDAEYVEIPQVFERIIKQHKIREFPETHYVFSYDDQPGPDLLGPKYIYRRHVEVLKAIGLEATGHDLYSWKHTGAIALWEATQDIDLIKRQCRHSDIKQTIVYLRDLGIRIDNSDQIHKFPDF
ncbi:hypothetical protein GCM10028818_01390 [Spirosoma horti]